MASFACFVRCIRFAREGEEAWSRGGFDSCGSKLTVPKGKRGHKLCMHEPAI